ncbi:hypothetical protein AGMMS49942_01220 [Spirochaetia bacterium]|nr:hypothetical protein AGMMS49942_01220 [Spirochaetia bacterium]
MVFTIQQIHGGAPGNKEGRQFPVPGCRGDMQGSTAIFVHGINGNLSLEKRLSLLKLAIFQKGPDLISGGGRGS